MVRLLAPLLFPCLALLLQVTFQDHIRSQKFLFFYPAVMLCGWVSGVRGAVLATFGSAFEVYFFLLEPDRLTASLSHDELIPLAVFTCIGLLISHYLSVEEKLVIQLYKKTKELEEANEARMSFLAHVSHEIRTPLNAVLGFAQLLLQDVKDPLQHGMVQRILTSGEYLLSLLNKILDFKRMEANQIELDLKTLNLASILAEIETTLMPMAHGKGIDLTFEVPEDKFLPLRGDPLRLKQIFFNLTTNAIKFTERGTVTFRARVLNAMDSECLMLFEVQDTGIGMEEGTLSLLFKPFVQADASIAGRFGGSGLGLSIVKQLVEMMGGRIGVQSRLGHGSLFWVELPFALDSIRPDTDAYSASKSIEESTGRLKDLIVLIADDNPLNIELVQRVLEREGGQCQSVKNGRELLDMLEMDNSHFDVLLVDLHMPVMNGIEAARTIRSNPALQHYPILAYTAEHRELMAESDLFDLFDGSIEKPIHVKDLINTLSKFADSSPVQNLKLETTTQTQGIWAQPDQALPHYVDSERFRDLFGSDLQLFMDLLGQFRVHFSFALDQFKQALRQNDQVSLQDLLHNIRGAAANLGLRPLAEVALKLELNLKAHGVADPNLQEDFEQVFLEVMGKNDLNDQSVVSEGTLSPISDREESSLMRFAILLSESNLEALDLLETVKPALGEYLSTAEAESLVQWVNALQFEKALSLLEKAADGQLPIRHVFSNDAGASQ